MKALKTLLIITVFLPYLAISQTLEEREKQMAANSQIATKMRTDFKFTSGSYSKTGTKSSLTHYDTDGNTTRVDYFNSKGVATGSEIYKYDPRGNRILFERTGKSPYKKVSRYNIINQILEESGNNGTEEFLIEYDYNSSGKLSEVVNSVSGQVRHRMEYAHTGNVASISIFIRGTQLSSKMKMEYDSKGNLLKEITYNLEGKETERKEYRYNSASKLTEEIKYSNGKFYYRINNSYDSEMRLTNVSEETISKKKYIKKEFVYDSKGNLTSYKWRRNPGEDFNIKKYTYDEKGACLTEETIYPKSNYRVMTKYSYTYH